MEKMKKEENIKKKKFENNQGIWFLYIQRSFFKDASKIYLETGFIFFFFLFCSKGARGWLVFFHMDI